MSKPQELNYAPRPPLHQRRSFRRWIAGALLIAFALSAWWWAPGAWRHTQLLYWQHQCMAYTPPLDQIVFDATAGVSISPPAWSNFYGLYSPPGFRSDGTIFLHELRNKKGESRLVSVDVRALGASHLGLSVNCRVFVPCTIGTFPEQSPFIRTDGPFACTHSCKIYAGIADPVDPSHFKISTIEDNMPYMYDGWLTDDNSVAIERRISKK